VRPGFVARRSLGGAADGAKPSCKCGWTRRPSPATPADAQRPERRRGRGLASGGRCAEGQRRFPLVVRLPDGVRTDPDALAATLIPTAGGPILPLDQVRRSRSWKAVHHQPGVGKRPDHRAMQRAGRDVKSFVAEGRARILAQRETPEATRSNGRPVREHGAGQPKN